MDRDGPGEFFLRHPGLFAASLAGAGGAALIFVVRGLRASGPRRLGWICLSLLEVVQVAGIVSVRALALGAGPRLPNKRVQRMRRGPAVDWDQEARS